MLFPSLQSADARLVGNSSKLTPSEVRDLIPWVSLVSEKGMRRLHVELLLQDLEAVQQFERSSSRLSRWLLVLTIVLVALTAVMTFYTYLLVRLR